MSDDPRHTFRPAEAPRARTIPLPLASAHLTSDGDAFIPEGSELPLPPPNASRPSIGVFFECANQYVRVYRDTSGNHYLARCPRCAKTMSFLVAPGGSPRRMFRASCR